MPPQEGLLPTTDDVEIYYRLRPGKGSPLVVPSASWLADDMAALAPERPQLFYDVRGRGRSSAIDEEQRFGLEKDLDDLERLRVHLGFERLSLLGWSYHGLLAARYALAHPDRVECLVLVGPSAPNAEPHFLDFLDRFAARMNLERMRLVERFRREGLKDRDPERWCHLVHDLFFRAYVVDPACLELMKSTPCVSPNLDPERVNNLGRRVLEKLGSYDYRPEFAALQTPTLIVHGAEDPVSLEGTKEWERALPNARLIVLDNVGHLPWLESPERFFPPVNAFLEPQT